jgi:hypothetical protein
MGLVPSKIYIHVFGVEYDSSFIPVGTIEWKYGVERNVFAETQHKRIISTKKIEF